MKYEGEEDVKTEDLNLWSSKYRWLQLCLKYSVLVLLISTRRTKGKMLSTRTCVLGDVRSTYILYCLHKHK